MSKIERYLPNNEYQAAVGANAPSAANPFATMADIVAPTLATGQIGFGSGANLLTGSSDFIWDDVNNIIYIGIGSGAFTNSKAHFQGSVNSYSQVNSINTSAGNSASTDFICTADNGTDSINYMDMGINSSTYNDAAYTISTFNDGYLYSNGGNLILGTQSAKDIVFHTGGTLAANRAATIKSGGQFLVATTTVNGGSLGIFRVGQGTSCVDIGAISGQTAGIWMGLAQATVPTTANFTLSNDNSATILRGVARVSVRAGTQTVIDINGSGNGIDFTPALKGSGLGLNFTYTQPANTAQTAGGDSIGVNWNMSAIIQHASNTIVPIQRSFVITAPTYSFATAGGVITSAATVAITAAPITGTNASITRPMALWVQSGISHFEGNVIVGTGTISTALLHISPGTATASTAPLKFTSGTNLTTAEAGAMEYNGTNLFFTRTGTTREGVLVGNGGAAAPGTSVGVGIVNYYGTAATNFLGDPVGWFSIVDNGGVARKVPYY